MPLRHLGLGTACPLVSSCLVDRGLGLGGFSFSP